ncbi:MAG: helix-turn-helix transcriptional regulator [Oscillospiraceae bacterium]|nr:helix-turn-helix transcriptional regulator [Oscillospiraceae bacterium]
MQMNEKIEILLARKRIRKTDFAESVGVTYRAFANYMNGSRKPRGKILSKIAEELELTPEFLLNDDKELELTIEERFIKRTCRSEHDKAAAMQFLTETRGLFAGNSFSEEDKEALFQCLIEIYNDCKKNKA